MGVLVKGATKTYRSSSRHVRALDGVELAADSSSVTLIVGTNGSGKSTLVKAVAGLLKLDSGEIEIDGISLSTVQEIARCRGMLQQVPLANLCPTFTVEEMIRLYLDGWSRDCVQSTRVACGELGIALSAVVKELSGGQQQLLALELILARHPSVLLLDEPTASLDPRHSTRILERVRVAANDGETVLLVTHNIEQGLTICDKVVLMHEGKIICTWGRDQARNLSADVLKRALVEAAARSLAGSA